MKKKVAYLSEMAKNAIESDFRSSKMGAGGHFVKQIFKKSASKNETVAICPGCLLELNMVFIIYNP